MAVLPKLRSDLVTAESTEGSERVYTLKDPVTGNYIRLRAPEHWLAQHLDGTATADMLAAAFAAKFELEIGATDIEQFVGQLRSLFLIEDGRSEQELMRAARAAQRHHSLAARLLYIKLKAFRPGRLLDVLTTMYKPFHRPGWILVESLIILTGLGLLLANVAEFTVNLSSLWSVASVATLLVAFFLLVTLHEFAHAVICRYHGGQVQEMGILIMYFTPCFYSDVSDAWLFPRKSQRLAVTWAGPYFQFLLLAVSVILWRLTVPGLFVNELARVTAIVCWVTFLFNFNPLIKLDGYYLLSDYLEVPNLRRKAFAYLGNFFQRVVLGWPIEPVSVTHRERRIYSLYATLALAYSTFLVVYFVWVLGRFAYEQWGGRGILLLIAALAVIMRQPLADTGKGMLQHFKYMRALVHKPIRLSIYVLLLIVMLVGLFVPWFPHRVSGEVEVEPLSQFTLSLTNLGLLESTLRLGGETPDRKSSFLKMMSMDLAALNVQPIVRDGQVIKAGDTLVVVRSNESVQALAAAEKELQRLEGELALLRAPKKKEQIAEATAAVNAAKATFDQSERDFKRIDGLYAKGLEAKDKLESARSAMDVAKADLNQKRSSLALLKSPPRKEEEDVLQRDIEKQRATLDYFKGQADAQTVTTPISGVAGANRRADTVLTVCYNQQVEMLVPVSDFDIKLVAKGQTARIKVRPYPSRVFAGIVVRVPTFTAPFKDRAYFPVSVVVDNQENLLSQGMTGYAKIEVGETSIANWAFRKLLSALRVEFWSWW
ncbi:MAG: site-2 protease family protein [Candidatus Zixiibacteriota bacterium]